MRGNEIFVYHKLEKSNILDSPFSDVKIWTKTIQKTYKKSKSSKIPVVNKVEIKTLYFIKCSTNQLGIEQELTYDSKGALINSKNDFSVIPENVAPETVGALIVEVACKLKASIK